MKYTHPTVIKDFLFQIDRFINNEAISESVRNTFLLLIVKRICQAEWQYCRDQQAPQTFILAERLKERSLASRLYDLLLERCLHAGMKIQLRAEETVKRFGEINDFLLESVDAPQKAKVVTHAWEYTLRTSEYRLLALYHHSIHTPLPADPLERWCSEVKSTLELLQQIKSIIDLLRKKKQETKIEHDLKQAENDFDILIDFPEFKDYLENYFSEKIKSICCATKEINHGELSKFISVLEKINIKVTVNEFHQYIKILEFLKRNPEKEACTTKVRFCRR